MSALDSVRTGTRAELLRSGALLVAVLLGTVHWLGLVAGGVLVGVLAPSLRRAFVLGLYVGLVVAAAFLTWLWLAGVWGKATGATQLLGPSLAVAVVFPVLGAGVRGLR